MSLILRLRTWVPAIAAGLVLAVAAGAAYAWRNPGQPRLLSIVVMAILTWPVLTIALQMLVFDRRATDAEIDRAKDDVERAWFQEAGATAFVTLIGGLTCVQALGDAFRIPWLSPIGLTHVLVLGLGTFALSYLWLRRRGR